MLLSAGLVLAFLAFCILLGAVFWVAIRERRAWHDLKSGRDIEGTRAAGEASDTRVALVIFGGIILGALLAIFVAYLVFFSGLAGA